MLVDRIMDGPTTMPHDPNLVLEIMFSGVYDATGIVRIAFGSSKHVSQSDKVDPVDIE